MEHSFQYTIICLIRSDWQEHNILGQSAFC